MRFNIILADCPWHYANRVQHGEGQTTKFGGGASAQYSLMNDQDLLDLGSLVKKIAADQSVLFLWGTFPRFDLALEVMKAWGFKFSTVAFQWIKIYPNAGTPFMGPGKISSSNSEPLLVGWRGKNLLPVLSKMQSQIVEWPHETEDVWEPHPREAGKIIHSAKPPIFHDKIEAIFGKLPRLEMFARQTRPGWRAIGNEITGRDIREDLEILTRLHGLPRGAGGLSPINLLQALEA